MTTPDHPVPVEAQRCARCGQTLDAGGGECIGLDGISKPHVVPAPSPEEPRHEGDCAICGLQPEIHPRYRTTARLRSALKKYPDAHNWTPVEEPVEAGELCLWCGNEKDHELHEGDHGYTPVVVSADPPSPEGGQRWSPFRAVVYELTNGCGCACHLGVGYNTSCVHCAEPTGAGQAEAPAPAVEVEAAIRAQAPTWEQVFEAIAHGDDDHRGWLREACENLWAGLPVPEPRGKNTTADLFEQLAAVTAERDEAHRKLKVLLEHDPSLATALRPPSTESKEAE